ncbi:hypothetical protein P692DRAFT_20830928 [Suillus brevipes Sb2]|nr:hypothetical protein P692DRAFT_20830928 [Suillus brevipes Sb2]
MPKDTTKTKVSLLCISLSLNTTLLHMHYTLSIIFALFNFHYVTSSCSSATMLIDSTAHGCK